MEFAWARQKNTKLQPLVIAVNEEKYLSVHVLARRDCTAALLADLKDMPVALPRGSQNCELFWKRQAGLHGFALTDPLAALQRPADVEDALDDVVEGKAEVAVVDGAGMECYQRRKPGRFARLKELHKPESFPVPIVAYVEGQIDDATLRTFKEGIVRAQRTAKGQRVLMLWKLTSFDPVPDDYPRLLDEVAQKYAPTAAEE
jgi:hypothetical protein